MRKSLLLFTAFLLISGVSLAQDRRVTGKITSQEDASTLPGVSVSLKGTAVGTVSDADGNYSISVPESGGILVFSFIGQKTQEIEVGTQSVINVQMAIDQTELSEVVVTGYQTLKKSELSSAISSVQRHQFSVG